MDNSMNLMEEVRTNFIYSSTTLSRLLQWFLILMYMLLRTNSCLKEKKDSSNIRGEETAIQPINRPSIGSNNQGVQKEESDEDIDLP
ncbi:hypothetical protein P3L10_001910 [Capsicum annuum]